MRWTFAAALVLAGAPLAAEDVTIGSSVYREMSSVDGERHIVRADRLSRGDRVITVLRWRAPRAGSYTAVTSIPAGLAIESASRLGIEVSTDGGQSWRRLADPDAVPRGTTHLRWRIDRSEGRLSYRAVVR